MAGAVRPYRTAAVDTRRRFFSAISSLSCRQKRLKPSVRFPGGNDGDGLSIETAPVVLTLSVDDLFSGYTLQTY